MGVVSKYIAQGATASKTLMDVAKMPHRPSGGRFLGLEFNLPGIMLSAALLGLGLTIIRPPITLATQDQNAVPGGWHLVRSKNPHGGLDAISVSHTADISRSDLDLAGIMLKCGEHGPEVVIVVVTPFPPRAQPELTITANGKEWHFVARVVPPGAELLLPANALQLVTGAWQVASELSVKVTSPEQSFQGVIPIEGLAGAFTELSVSCHSG
jgi:hypothetical protein